MKSSLVPLIIFLGLTIFIIVIATLNPSYENLLLPNKTIHLTLGLTLIIAYALGMIAGLAMLYIRLSKTSKAKQNLNQWEQQDVKLLAEVKSDREKQLEAKIATLESALKAALKNQ